MRKKIMALLIAGCMSVVMLTGCSTYKNDNTTPTTAPTAAPGTAATTTPAADNTSTAQISDTVNILGGVAVTMNEFASQASNDYDFFYLTQSSLVRYYAGKVEMDAAESNDVSTDGLTYTFHLRQGLTYSDGTPITSADFAYAFQKFVGPDSGSAECSAYYEVVGVQDYNTKNDDGTTKGTWDAVGFKTPDANTVVFTLTKPDGAFLNNLAINAFYPITQQFAEKYGDTLGSSADTVLCSGPYILKDWTVNTSMSLVKNDKWWNAATEFPTKNVNVQAIDNANTKVSMFQNGQADIISSVDPNYVSTLGDQVKSYVGNTEMLLWMNEAGNNSESAKLMGNENFRKALTFALDRNTICSAVSAGFVGTNRAVSSNYPGTTSTYVNDYPIDACPVQGDAAQAKDFLKAAMDELGYTDVSQLPQLTYVTFERDDMKLLGETLVDSWKQVLGISNIQFTSYPIGTAIQQFYGGKYDIFMISVGCTISPTDIMKGFASDSDYGFFVTNWKTNVSDLLKAADALPFQSDDYFKKVADLETAFLNEYSIVPLYNQTFFYALGDGVQGFVEPGIAFQYQLNHLTVSK